MGHSVTSKKRGVTFKIGGPYTFKGRYAVIFLSIHEYLMNGKVHVFEKIVRFSGAVESKCRFY